MARDARGRFVKGGAGGPGRPKGPRRELLEAFRGEVTVDVVKHTFRALVVAGLKGDVAAAKAVLELALGRPGEHGFVEDLQIEAHGEGNALIAAALQDLVRQAAAGDVAPSTLKEFAEAMAKTSDVLERADLEERIKRLEGSRT